MGQARSTSKNRQNKRHKSFKTSTQFLLDENLKIKGFKTTDTRQKKEPRKTNF